MSMKFSDYAMVFTPGIPVQDSKFLFGRDQQFNDLERAINRPGLHPIIVGDRGVGKTSLVQLWLAERRKATSDFILNISGNYQMTWDIFGSHVFRGMNPGGRVTETAEESQVAADGKLQPGGIGVGSSVKFTSKVTKEGQESERVDVWTLFKTIVDSTRRVLIVIDEYGVIHRDSDVHHGIADLIKTLSDNWRICNNSRVIVSGVARSAEDLLGKHESIERNAREIYLPALREQDICEFLTQAEEELRFSFEYGVRKSIAEGSQGYPSYAHRVGLECVDAMLKRDKNARIVTAQDHRVAISRAVDQAFRSELRKYKERVQGIKETDPEMTMLREIVSLLPDRKISRTDLIRLLAEKGLKEDLVNSTIMKLQQERKLIYISRNRDELRLTDPLLGPFLKDLWGLSSRQYDSLYRRTAIPTQEEDDDTETRNGGGGYCSQGEKQ